jgi:Fe2+ or Zn2+ uptake regulation protein
LADVHAVTKSDASKVPELGIVTVYDTLKLAELGVLT